MASLASRAGLRITNQPEQTMNTETPRTDEWETYCDECYYHMWRVRRKNERGFNDGFHVQNGEGARQLVELLNKQDDELIAARELVKNLEITVLSLMMENKTVTEQRDRLAEALQACREDSVELLGERCFWQNEPRCDYQKRWQETHDNLTRADEALQSLTTNEQ